MKAALLGATRGMGRALARELAGSGAASAITGKALLEGAFTVAEAVEYLE